MLLAGTRPDLVLLSQLLLHQEPPLGLEEAKLLDAIVCSSGYARDLLLGTSLLVWYGRCGRLEESKAVFSRMEGRDAAAWNAMIWSAILSGEKKEALTLFQAMKDEGVAPEGVDYWAALKACELVSEVRALHAEISSRKMEGDPDVASALIDCYGQLGELEVAEQLLFTFGLEEAPCWTSLLVAYARHGYHSRVIQVFHEMQHRRLTANFATFAAVLDACAGLGALVEGRVIHRRVVEVEKLPIAGTLARSLVNMYAKCGELGEAWSVFEGVTGKRELRLWNTCIDAFAAHGQGHSVLQLFQLMQQEGVKPDQTTFSRLLFVCCYVGLVEVGYAFFALMITDHLLSPSLENYACMVDLLGRAGNLDGAQKLITRTPYQSSPVLWRSLLAACGIQGDVERGKRAAVQIFTLDPTMAEVYVVLSRIYESTAKPAIARKVKLLMKERDVSSELARSWIQISGVIHSFTTGDQTHPQTEEIYAALQKLEADYPAWEAAGTSNNDLTMHDVDEEDENSVHSEKLALVVGLMNSRFQENETPVVVFKNKRMCRECHSFFATISKVAARDIVVRDSSRFHWFRQCSCSCGDYW
ncbi:pentatricopeptide repeat-containing protein At5g04780, mitochondrial [Selaginella moellendorffii]|uniref:pentatricopeptide repeat-containing protein At5g04780, mitochondrial n=1 Tax=Selaginella moellendorffii TaxID=88036 RepID=UPI000D1CF2B9|nr:pentatricopeptide repeat-containing protein At5g04780, mitochondrial [Selaginella moellendorffii]|eukprot:XP_024541280.1 pentatricopeptide repeat-containing protein At5g04780, mitochondrial [Selaginella moellendorffii]